MTQISGVIPKNITQKIGLSDRPKSVCQTDRFDKKSVCLTDRMKHSLKHNTNTQVCARDVAKMLGMNEQQVSYIIERTGVGFEELQKAANILKESKPINKMKLLLTSAFHDGVCILEPDPADVEDARVKQYQEHLKRETARVKTQAQENQQRVEEYQSQIVEALKWFQSLTNNAQWEIKKSLVEALPSFLREKHAARIAGGDFPASVLHKLVDYWVQYG